jgi:hypothetical protein
MPGGKARTQRTPAYPMLLDQHVTKLEGHLRAAKIPKKDAKRFKNAAERVLGNMTDEGLRRLKDNLNAYYFYPDLSALRAEAGLETTLGFYRGSNRTLHLDCGEEGRDSIHHIYAHEYTHALDGPNDDISGLKEWQEAWQEEMVEGYAFGEPGAEAPDEGLAQLGELMLRGKRAEGRRRCPKCVAIWEGLGL